MVWLPVSPAAIISGLACAGSGCAPPSQTVSTSYATYSGNYSAPYSLAFLGIPYAEPPVGNLRFRKPVPLITDHFYGSGIIDATTFPRPCVQGTTGLSGAGGDGVEDCLKVNIYKPVNATASSKLPVLFYIHGGGYQTGNPANFPFDHWINQSPNIVVVSVYYRLSSLGFLSHSSFSNSTNGDFNVGILDQTLALKWVKDNIAAFGGDPDHITINGESAGGGSVQLHLVSKESKGLFHGAIAQSPARMAMPKPPSKMSLFYFYAYQAGCGGGTDTDKFNCLRAAPIDVLARAQDSSSEHTGSDLNNWVPVMEDNNFADYPSNLIQQGNYAKVPIITGSTTDEYLFVNPGQTLEQVLRAMYPKLTSDDIAEFQALYSRSFTDQDELITTAAGEILLRCGAEILGNANVQYKAPVWTYRYNQPNPTRGRPGMTEHAAENWMMFLGTNSGPNGTSTFTDLDRTQTSFSRELIAYWISFVRTFDPNTYKLPRSEPWTSFADGPRVVLQQLPPKSNPATKSGIVLELESQPEAERCLFIADRSTILQN